MNTRKRQLRAYIDLPLHNSGHVPNFIQIWRLQCGAIHLLRYRETLRGFYLSCNIEIDPGHAHRRQHGTYASQNQRAVPLVSF